MARKMNKEKYIEKIKEIYGERYTLISEFVDMNTKVTIKCNICGKDYTLLPNEFTRNREKNRKRFIDGCDYCRLLNKTESIKKEVEKLTNGKISVIEKELISDTHSKINMKCNVCGYEFKQSLHVIKNNLKDVKDKENTYGCANCSKKLKKNTKTFKQEVYNLVGDEYEVIGEYINTNTPIKMKHCKCGNVWKLAPVDFINKDNRCPECCSCIVSNASKFIERFLIENEIEFIKEKKFKECKHKRQLPFDFYLPEYDLLIEYDGRQHFYDEFGSNKAYLQQHKRDLIKNKFCIENEINLMRIKYNISIPKIKSILEKLIDKGLTLKDYKKYNLYVVDCDEDIIFNSKNYYKEFYK